MKNTGIMMVLDAEDQGHWLVALADYQSELGMQVVDGLDEYKVLSLVHAAAFAGVVEGRISAGMATQEDMEWLELMEYELPGRKGGDAPGNSGIRIDVLLDWSNEEVEEDKDRAARTASLVRESLHLSKLSGYMLCVNVGQDALGVWRLDVTFYIDEPEPYQLGRIGSRMLLICDLLDVPYETHGVATVSIGDAVEELVTLRQFQ